MRPAAPYGLVTPNSRPPAGFSRGGEGELADTIRKSLRPAQPKSRCRRGTGARSSRSASPQPTLAGTAVIVSPYGPVQGGSELDTSGVGGSDHVARTAMCGRTRTSTRRARPANGRLSTLVQVSGLSSSSAARARRPAGPSRRRSRPPYRSTRVPAASMPGLATDDQISTQRSAEGSAADALGGQLSALGNVRRGQSS
jgi:hypothetical protein